MTYYYLKMGNRIFYLHTLEVKLFNKAAETAMNISNINFDWKTDIRYTTYNTLSSVIRFAKLSVMFRDQCLEKDDWWNSNYDIYFSYLDQYADNNLGDKEIVRMFRRQTISDDFIKTMIVGLYTSCFSILESRVRVFYNYLLNPSEKGKIKEGNFSKLVEGILDLLNLDSKSGCIELFCNARNTIHNNGVYTQSDETVNCSGRSYKFEKGNPPNYGDSLDLLILRILPEVVEIMDKMISRLLVERIILDPFAKEN
ncbi:hypothetical protein NARC_140008 [Candidatus Nitrosocosmicus arcticus]|uniref:Uncharacterized protein n=2 Tax=Candidatus Nitrosocosmicus arcticus TaxID=2035267 RepID=A0A557SSG9_9ARCH|nr:hypothetical protein NARC_140008 [Candidatus Nitrosocosmicus arcticus]